jgi:phosphatidyl-myo-inositol alpha-mannosyltransferase
VIDAALDERSHSIGRRIALVCPYSLDTPGGVQHQVLALERALTRLDHRVTVLAPGPTGGLGRTIAIPVNGSIAQMAPHPAGAYRTTRALTRNRFDVVHLHEPLAPSITIPTLLLHCAPTVATFHAAGERTPYRWCGALARRLARRIDALVAVSDAATELVHRHLGLTCTVLYNGIELERFGPGRPDRRSRSVLFLGRHEERKGLEVLLKATAGLPKDVTIVIGGTGPDSPRLRDGYCGDPRIVWLGQVSEATKLELLHQSSVLCAPSRHGESFGVVLLEAMAAGLPVVASDLPGYRELSNGGTAARLVPSSDPTALARELNRVLSDDHLADSLRTAGMSQARRFSMDTLAERYVEIYEGVLVTSRQPRVLDRQ